MSKHSRNRLIHLIVISNQFSDFTTPQRLLEMNILFCAKRQYHEASIQGQISG